MGGLGHERNPRHPSPAPQLRRQQPLLKRRRLAAAALFAQGLPPAAVARRLGVSRQSAHRWYHAWQAGGIQALRARGPIGRHRKLSAAQLGQLAQALLQGATAHGFASNLWTLDRVTQVIRRQTGVRHHPVQVWRILTQRVGWSLQRPRRHAAERDQAAIDEWRTVHWPRIKQGHAADAPGWCSWTRAAAR
jgi:transposase